MCLSRRFNSSSGLATLLGQGPEKQSLRQGFLHRGSLSGDTQKEQDKRAEAKKSCKSGSRAKTCLGLIS